METISYEIRPIKNSESASSAYPCFFSYGSQKFTIKRTTNFSHGQSSLYKIITDSNGKYGTLEYNDNAYGADKATLTFYTDLNKTTTLFTTQQSAIFSTSQADKKAGFKINIASINDDILNIDKTNGRQIVAYNGAKKLFFYNDNHKADEFGGFFTLTIYVQPVVSAATIISYQEQIYSGDLTNIVLSSSAGNNVNFNAEWWAGQRQIASTTITSGNNITYTIDHSESSNTSGTLKVKTLYNGTEIGYDEKNITFKVKAAVVAAPTITIEISGNKKQNNNYIQNYSDLTVNARVSSTVGISKCTINTPDKSQTFDNNNLSYALNIATIKKYGTYICSVTAQDVEGNITTTSKTIDVIEYSPPSIYDVSIIRYNDEDVYKRADEDGNCVIIRAKTRMSRIKLTSATWNTVSLSYKLCAGNSTIPLKSGSLDTSSQQIHQYNNDIGKVISSDAVYKLELTATDGLGSTSTIITLAAQNYSIHVRRGDIDNRGTGVAVGTVSTEGSVFAVAENWTPKWGAYTMPRVSYNEAPPAGNLGEINGLLWLSPGTYTPSDSSGSSGSSNIVFSSTRPSYAYNGMIWLQPLPQTAMIPIVAVDGSEQTRRQLTSYFEGLPIMLQFGNG